MHFESADLGLGHKNALQKALMQEYAWEKELLPRDQLLKGQIEGDKNRIARAWISDENQLASRFNNWYREEIESKGKAGAAEYLDEKPARELFAIVSGYPLESENERRAAA